MSQAGPLSSSGGGGGGTNVQTLTGDVGGPVGPNPVTHNINFVGNSGMGIIVVGNPGLNTLTIVPSQATTSQFGVIELATDAQAIAGTDTANALTSSNLAAKLGTQTAHTVAIFEGVGSALAPSNVGTNGQVLIAGTGVDPAFATLTSSDSSISFTTGSNSLSLQVAGGTTVGKTITGNSGGALSPTAGNWNILGTGSITTSGAGSTLTTQLTGLTNHAVLIGAGTATITNVVPSATSGQVLQSAGAAADPVFSTATYPATTTINQILYSSSANIVAGLATANQGVLTTGATGIPVITTLGTNGQLIIGSTAGVPAAATLTAGAGISITNGSNAITITATGAGFTWTDVTGATQTIVAENGYLADRGGGVAFTLPASGTIGDTFRIVGVQGSWTLAQAAGQQIKIGSKATTVGVGGSLASTNPNDCIECVASNTSASTVWIVMSSMGNITVV